MGQVLECKRFSEFFEDNGSRILTMSRLQVFIAQVAATAWISYDTATNGKLDPTLFAAYLAFSGANYLGTKAISASLAKKQADADASVAVATVNAAPADGGNNG